MNPEIKEIKSDIFFFLDNYLEMLYTNQINNVERCKGFIEGLALALTMFDSSKDRDVNRVIMSAKSRLGIGGKKFER